jgi:hypothetical protein
MSGYEVKTDLGTIRLQHNGLIYTASALDNNRIIENNAFVAKISGSGYQYPAIQVINPYADGEILIRTIEKGIQTFFVNPAAKMSYVDTENIITFSDENTVVKYYQNDVLDYANYRIGNGGNNLLRNFGTAISFIELDKSVVNEFYFAGYEKSENGEFTFYFNYVINNLPIFLPDEYKLKDKGGAALQHSIEVTVKAEHVVHYRKLVYRYEPDTVLKEAQVDFDEAVDIELSQSQTTGVLRDVLLGYKIDRNKQAILFWIMPTSGGTLSKAA